MNEMHEIEIWQDTKGKWRVSLGDVCLALFQTQQAAQAYAEHIMEQNGGLEFTVIG